MNEEIVAQLRALREQLGALSTSAIEREEALRSRIGELFDVLERIHDDDPRARRGLRELRASADYELAFTEPDPLVSVVIPTWNRAQELVERSIPSALAQSHPNIEVVVVGDAAPPEVGAAIEEFGDPRVRFHNLTVRGPYEESRLHAWLASGTPGYNAAVTLAGGRWIAPLGDDDAFEPDHIAHLLTYARERRLEFVYDLMHQILPDGSESMLGEFPPRVSRFGLQASMYHSGLGFMELELGHALFGKPNDWGLIHRMMRSGVRIGMLDEAGVRYWPSLRAMPDGTDEAPVVHTELDETRRLLGEASDRAAGFAMRLQDTERALESARHQLAEASRRWGEDLDRAADLQRRLDTMLASRSWRLTRILRRVRAGR